MLNMGSPRPNNICLTEPLIARKKEKCIQNNTVGVPYIKNVYGTGTNSIGIEKPNPCES